jgi:dipeptidyl aminopeptidase/acylaminoacyl peptidase
MDSTGKSDTSKLLIWDGEIKTIASTEDCTENYYIPAANKLSWSKDGARLFFGVKKPLGIMAKAEDNDTVEVDIYDIDKLVDDRDLNVWHWHDPLIKTNEIKEWEKKKKHVFYSVYHVDSEKIVFLADEDMPNIIVNNNPDYSIGYADKKYQKLKTWDGQYYDYVLVDLSSGERDIIAEKIQYSRSFSPDGGYLAYYKDEQWYLYNTSQKTTINLTSRLETPFANEDHDYPMAVPDYGLAGWLEDDAAVLIYDKYDIWKFDTGTSEAENLTGGYGREKNIRFRLYKLNKEKEFFNSDETLLLSAFHYFKKYTSIYSFELNSGTLTKLVNEEKKYTVRSKAKKSDRIIFTKETYNEFPDLRVSDMNLTNQKRLSEFDSQRDDFAWGSAELIEWNSIDGIPLQGVVIKPENFDEGKPYPVLVYYYRFFSQRIHEFNDMVINHRPNFAYYVSNGYVVFLPDIRFEVGRPGYSATKCLVPGVQKLIDLGIAKPDAIALHGHSWSGYQTAFVVTQTDMFACAVAGAPVSNMTSAYSGIRWGSGLARQFQYEKSQSRIGVSLFENPMPYIENSPVFYADKINTPLLIQHGDKDEAVPWYQSIELYLAMRRLGKDCIFLQYEDEPHHLKKYPNKLDYSIKMKEFVDYHCKGTPAPEWITKGETYIGE